MPVWFNVTIDDSVGKATYSLDDGKSMIDLVSFGDGLYRRGNHTLIDGKYTATFFVTDKAGNLNDTEQVTFEVSAGFGEDDDDDDDDGGGGGGPDLFEGDEPGECSDGADNDQDSLFDCQDGGCAQSPVCAKGGGGSGDGGQDNIGDGSSGSGSGLVWFVVIIVVLALLALLVVFFVLRPARPNVPRMGARAPGFGGGFGGSGVSGSGQGMGGAR